MPSESTMSVRQVARELDVSAAAVYLRIQRGRLEADKSGPEIRLPREAVIAWREQRLERTSQ